MTTIRAEVASLRPLEIVQLFEIDASMLGIPGPPLRWHPGTKADGASSIVWQGAEYKPYPIMADGFELSANGTLPRPRLTASNLNGNLGAFLDTIEGGLGAKLTRRRTLGKYLDGQPEADPTAAFPDEVYTIARKVSEDPIQVVLECAVAFDVEGVVLPRRQVIAGACMWVYRGPECGYAGPPVEDINGNYTANPDLDRCRKTLTSCAKRFPGQALRTSAFPASLLVR
jgi:lambda family phage minor tail protein L